jgi:hypothetical protein
MVYAIEDLKEELISEKITTSKEVILVGLDQTEFDQLMQNIAFQNRMHALFYCFLSLSLSTILLNLVLIKYDTEKIIRAVT